MASEYKSHPAADAYPMLSEGELNSLAESIRIRGLIHDIVLLDELVIDGRNRLVACRMAGIEPRFVDYQGDRSPKMIAAYVRAANDLRRHMRSDQKAAAAVLLTDWESEADAAEQRRQEGRKRGGGDRKSDTVVNSENEDRSPQNIGGSDHDGETNEVKAKEHGTNRQYIADIKKLDRETVEKIRDGELTLAQAKSAAKESDQTAERRTLNKQLARPTIDIIKNLRNSPGILVSPGWWRPKDEDWQEDLIGWKLNERLDSGGGIIVFRTMGDTRAALEAMSLIESWGMQLLAHQVIVCGAGKTTNNSAELLVIGTVGKPDLGRLPTKERNQVACPESGIESLVLSWFRPWAKERGTLNLIAEILGSDPHEGFQHHPWKPEEA